MVSNKVKISNIILFVLFFVFAVLQLNDPDPFLWVFIYMLTAFLAIVSNYRTLPKVLLWVVLGALLIYSIFYVPALIDWLQIENKNEIFGEMVYDKPYLEGTREFLGLLLAAAAIFYLIKQK